VKINFFDKPQEIVFIMLSFFSPKTWRELRLVSKKMDLFFKGNVVWGNALNMSSHNKDKDNVFGIENMLTYKKDLEARKPAYIPFDRKGKILLSQIINKELNENKKLSKTQKLHLGSMLMRRSILNGDLTIEQAILNSSPSVIKGFDSIRKKGIEVGLLPTQVNPDWFCETLCARDIETKTC